MDSEVGVSELSSGSLRAIPFGQPLTGHTGPVWWGAWGQVDNQPVLATGSYDGMVRLWEVVADRAVARLPSYRSDVAGASDELARGGDAVAVAELITARSAKPPLAVGLFGDWGEGKSHFLSLVWEQVRVASRESNRLAHHAVRQVWFNAWHYAETDLWASLVSELFTQLAKPPDTPAGAVGDLGAEQRSQSRLMAELVAQRGLRARLQAARDRRDELQQALRRLEREPRGPWASLTPDQRRQLSVLAGGRADQAEHIYRRALRTGLSVQEITRSWWRLLRGIRFRTVAVVAGVVLAMLAVTVTIAWGIPAVQRWVATLPAAVTIGAVVAGIRRLRAEGDRLKTVWQTAVEFGTAAVRMGEAHQHRLQTLAEVAAAEVSTLEREMQNLTAAGQLAGFVTDRAAGGDYRSRLGVMTQIREDFQHMATLLATATRQDPPTGAGNPTTWAADPRAHQHRDSSGGAGSAPPVEDEAGDRLPEIDRIILYIDDLDRCPPDRVVAVLEAIHLLLAVELFVVVVAVDPRWLLRAITAHYKDLLHRPTTSTPGVAPTAPEHPASPNGEPAHRDLISVDPVDPDDKELWGSTPEQYLEKIFQVVLTLPPLDATGYRQLLHTLVGPREDQAPPPPVPMPASTPAPARATVAAASAVEDTSEPAPPAMFGVRLPRARVVERVDPLTLTPDELTLLTLLTLLGPPCLVTTPRTVKRLANSYGLLTAIRRDHRDTDLAEQHTILLDPTTGDSHPITYWPYRAGLVLLGALVAYPSLGPALLRHLHHTAADHPHHTWTAFLDDLQPAHQHGCWSNPADPAMTRVQAHHWQALLRGLHHITTHAAHATPHALPLPEPLTAWAHWVIPAGRLSFPAGSIINTLHSQPDTTPTPNLNNPTHP